MLWKFVLTGVTNNNNNNNNEISIPALVNRNVTRIFLEFLESEKVSKFGNFGAKLVINLSLRED